MNRKELEINRFINEIIYQKMTKRIFKLRNVVAIAICLAGMTMFSGCDKDPDPNGNGNTEKTPKAVMNFTATVGNGQVCLSWDAPSNNGGSEITGYEVTMDNWVNKVTKTASELSHTYTGLTNGILYTFKVRAVNVNGSGEAATTTATPINQGILINGVRWATCNVDESGTFAAKPEDAGKFYQWNRKKAWAATGNVTGWDTSTPTGTIWATVNDPSPNGWRVPTKEEIESLLDKTYVIIERTTSNGISGYRFTDKATENNIFLPAAGWRDSDGVLNLVGDNGCYWGNALSWGGLPDMLLFSSGGAGYFVSPINRGLSVRPVKI